jgi:hypothetical protein
MTGRLWLGWVLSLMAVVVLASPSPAQAHGFQTAYLEILEQAPGEFALTWKTPTNLSFGDEGLARPMTLRPGFPDHCQAIGVPQRATGPTSQVSRWGIRCGERGLAGQTLTFPGVTATGVEVLVHWQGANGQAQTTLVPAGQESLTLPVRLSFWRVGQTYLRLGISHIFSGVDHLLFVLGLVLMVRPGWPLVKTISAFTLAHSITLAAATLGWVQVPQAPVEAVIALSIVFLAVELVNRQWGQVGFTATHPWLVALIFGLLHGFGFAGALATVGLPAQAIPPALLCFNLGVELGQLAFVLALVGLITLLRPLALPPWGRWLAPYGIGALAACWCLQRVVGFWESS